MDEPEIQQTDTAADSSDELETLLAQYVAETSRPAAVNGHADDSADAPHNGADRSQVSEPTETSGDGFDVDWLLKQVELENKEMDLRGQRAQLYTKEKAINDTIENYISVRQQEQHEADLKTAISQVRGDMDSKFFDDKFVTAFIDKEARDNIKLQEIWQNRFNNLRALATAINHLAKDFQKTYSRMPDPNVTEDRALVAAAIRGASAPAQTEPPPNYARLSNADMRDEMRKLGIQPNF
jgi:uncharacterized protein (UPF0335 family)